MAEKLDIVTYSDVLDACKNLKDSLTKTECSKSKKLSELLGMEVYLKHEYMQYTGSFKERGAMNALFLLSEEKKKKGVIASSSGNHGLGVSYHGKLMNIPITLCMPKATPANKASKCRALGANVIIVGESVDEARKHALDLAEKQGLTYINGYDDPHVMAGQGTIMVEILEKVPDVDVVVAPVGGGGLCAGLLVVAKHINPNIKIISVETNMTNSLEEALKNKAPVVAKIDAAHTCAEGLSVGMIGANPFKIISSLMDKHVVINETLIPLAILKLMEAERCAIEGSGVVPIAAALGGKLEEFKGKKVVFVLTGGNIDTPTLISALRKGMLLDNRLAKFEVKTIDRVGKLAEIINILVEFEANVMDIKSNRSSTLQSVYEVEISFEAFLPTAKQYFALKEKLESIYGDNLTWNSKSILQDDF